MHLLLSNIVTILMLFEDTLWATILSSCEARSSKNSVLECQLYSKDDIFHSLDFTNYFD